MNWLEALPVNRRRGSYPRCLVFVEGNRQHVAQRLTAMAGLAEVEVRKDDFWMPQGLPKRTGRGEWDLSPTHEAKLGEDAGFLSPKHRDRVTQWWLEVIPRANTPNWDIASTCRINGKKGVLLVEAKAYDRELASSGKAPPTTANGIKNHRRIEEAIKQANTDLNRITPGWNLSRDSHYQLCNRFAWSWKLARLGVPVVLMYLGFLHADEMADLGAPFAEHAAWLGVVMRHARGVVPDSVWDSCLKVDGTPMYTLVRSCEVNLR